MTNPPFRLLLVIAGIGGSLMPIRFSTYAVSSCHNISADAVVIHHSAVDPESNDVDLDASDLDAIHARRGFGVFFRGRTYHIGYHYVVTHDGTVQSGRPEDCDGAHTRGHNSALGICLVGHFGSNRETRLREPNSRQFAAAADLVAAVLRRYGLSASRVFPHRALSVDSECPGAGFPWVRFEDAVRQRLLHGDDGEAGHHHTRVAPGPAPRTPPNAVQGATGGESL